MSGNKERPFFSRPSDNLSFSLHEGDMTVVTGERQRILPGPYPNVPAFKKRRSSHPSLVTAELDRGRRGDCIQRELGQRVGRPISVAHITSLPASDPPRPDVGKQVGGGPR